MFRQLHRYPGLIAGLVVITLAVSGAILSVMPGLQKLGTPAAAQDKINVAQMAGNILANYNGVEQIIRKPSGKVVVYYFANDIPGADIVSPVTGEKVADYAPSGFTHWMTDFHRSLFLGDTGRAAAGIGAFAMLVLAYSGLSMAAKRQGGWRKMFGRVRGNFSQKIHVEAARFAAAGFVLTGLTAVYMSLTTFGFLPDGSTMPPDFPTEVNGGSMIDVSKIGYFQDLKLSALRDLSFPYADDPTDVFSITTSMGSGYIDQSTGELLVFQANNMSQNVYEFIVMLHTGRGLWWLALLTGAAALTIPLLATTGALVWFRGKRASPKISGNVAAKAADTIILVGSEGKSTWGFAKALHDGLKAQGFKVHTAPMNSLKKSYGNAKRMFILSATYGDGAAPETAQGFLKKLDAISDVPDFEVAVLGFGDRQFPNFCQFAQDVNAALIAKGWCMMQPLENIDRQSVQEFSRWGQALATKLGTELTLNYKPIKRKTTRLELISRQEFGADVQAPTTIFRFAAPEQAHGNIVTRLFKRGLPKFTVGDLVGITPPGSSIPRFYSLASSSKDRVLEICVRKHAAGLCSGHLHSMEIGGDIDIFIQPNPDFRPAKGKAPVILIGAGTGVGPLAGFIRANNRKRPMHLFFGGRNPASDFLYQDEISGWLGDQRLRTLSTAFSRVTQGSYVQDCIKSEAEVLQKLIGQGAQIMVCGGRDMASGVMNAFEQILVPVGLCPATLKAEGRYLEDVY